MDSKSDFIIHAEGYATVWGFEPQNDAARELLAEIGTEDWQWVGNVFYTDHRPARDLARYMTDIGFTVLHPQYGYFRG